jgi:predicted XRE-type DNA-binding protein
MTFVVSFAGNTVLDNNPSAATPLQLILGFDAAEELYDALDLREQLIIDLKIAGWSQHEIGEALGLSQGWVSILFRRSRFKLANSKLLHTLEIRQHFKDTSPILQGASPGHFEDNN